MSDYRVINGTRVRVDKCDSRVKKGEMRDKYIYCLQRGRQKADIVNKGIDETYIELRQNENRANGAEETKDPLTTVTTEVSIGGKKVAASTG